MESKIVAFDMFEHQKENIQPLREGRSAIALAKAFNPDVMKAPRDLHSTEREQFEKKIDDSEDLDDPLEVWIDYLQWTHETYPQGASTESGLILLLERCTAHFQNATHYANDPRYLRVWLEYIQYNDSPREVFVFLIQHQIGLQLATLYEHYANYLESVGRKYQAGELYQLGINNEARPLARLRKRYTEFLHRLESNPMDSNEPRSPVMPVIRPALATKELALVETESNPQERERMHSHPAETSRPRQKMTIFADPDGSAASEPEKTGGWESIGTIAERRKENRMESRPLAGETMRMMQAPPSTAEKLSIFRDSSAHLAPIPQPQFKVPSLPQPQQQQQSQNGKREEKFAVNLAVIYPDDGNEELSFEELRAQARGLLRRKSKHVVALSPATSKPSSTPLVSRSSVDRTPLNEQRSSETLTPSDRHERDTPRSSIVQTMPIKDSPDLVRRRPASPTMTLHTRAATDEIYSLFNQPLRCDQDDIQSRGISDSSDEDEEDNESEEDENSDSNDDEENEGNSADNGDDDGEDEELEETPHGKFKAGLDSQDHTTGDLSRRIETPTKSNENDTTNSQERPESRELRSIEMTSANVPLQVPVTPSILAPKDRFGIAMMTPIVEATESIATVVRSVRNKANRFDNVFEENLESSPFVEHPGTEKNDTDILQFSPIFVHKSNIQEGPGDIWSRDPVIPDLLINPMEDSVRCAILESAIPSVESFDGFYEYKNRRLDAESLKRRLKGRRKNSKPTEDVEIELCNGRYILRQELGEGAFAPVYLCELADENMNVPLLRAMKIEHPPSAWEFYIMKEIERRLNMDTLLAKNLRIRALESMVRAQELHVFADTTCLVLNYIDQGTILDVVNLVKADCIKTSGLSGHGLDECLVIFFTIELLRTIEALHTVGILHGDLKPDNCMVRILPEKSSGSMAALTLKDSNRGVTQPYSPTGEHGWSSKGVSLIDFGRAIDMTSFDHKHDVQFIADWKTCAQDCAEMRELRPWTYQVDYHGLASIIHMMLFGTYIETIAETVTNGRRKHHRLAQSFKRYWQQDIWKGLFELLLNSVAESTKASVNEVGAKPFPPTRQLREFRLQMENFLEVSGEKNGMSLRGSLQRLEHLIASERRKPDGKS